MPHMPPIILCKNGRSYIHPKGGEKMNDNLKAKLYIIIAIAVFLISTWFWWIYWYGPLFKIIYG